MATRALSLSGLCILFLLLTASHVLPSTKAARILEENKAAGIDGEDRQRPVLRPSPAGNPSRRPATTRGRPYTRRCNSYNHCPPEVKP